MKTNQSDQSIKLQILGRQPSTFGALVALVLLAGAATSHATSDAWVGTTDATWATSGNWLTVPGVVPGAGDTATFNGAGNANTTINLGAGVTLSNLVFDTASAAAYTVGSGAVGSQTLTLGTAGGITLNSGVANNQLINANLSLSTAAAATTAITNESSSLLTIAGGISANLASGNGLLTVRGSGNTTVTGAVTKPGAGTNSLLKAGSGTLTLSSGSVWSGTAALGRIPATAAGFPLVAREGNLLLNGGTHTVTGELVIGGVVADGGAGQNAKITVNSGTLAVSSWLSVGRGNGVGGVSSDLVLSNAAVVTAANFSAGQNGGNALNLPRGSVALSDTSSFTVTGNGLFNFAESTGSDMTLTLNNSAQVVAAGTGLKHIGQLGKGTLNISNTASALFGNAILNIGYRTGTGVVNVASGTLRNSGEIRVGGSDQSGTGPNGNGTLNISGGSVEVGALTIARGNNNLNTITGSATVSGGTLWCTNDLTIGFAGNNNLGKLTISGGTVNVGPAATKWLMVGRWDTTPGQLDITSGVLNLMNNTAIKMNADGTIGANVVNQNGGSVNFFSDAGITSGGTGDLDLQRAGSAASVNTYNLNGGTLTVPRVISTATTGTRTFNFNGGTLKAAASSATFVNLVTGAGVGRINVRNGGAIIDSNGKDITINQSLDHSNVGGDAAVDGGLNKSGAGTLTLAAGSTYTGNTVVSGGGLTIAPSAFPYTVGSLSLSNTALTMDVTGGSSALTPVNVTLQNNTTVTVGFGGLAGNPAVAAINASGSLTAPGTAIIVGFSGVGFTPGTFTLIDYTGAALANLANFTLVTPPGVTATLVNNTANTSIDVLVTTSPQNLTWYGTNSNWNVNNTYNFNTASALYLEYGTAPNVVGDAVRFDDNLFNDFINPQSTNVNLTAALSSFPVTVDSTLPYIFSGPGSLTGISTIVKSNTGTLTLVTSNSYTGGTVISGGSVIITNDYALGAATSKITLAGGALQVNENTTNATRALSVTGGSTLGVATNKTYQLGGIVNGSGSLTKTDDGTLILTGNNTNTGSLIVNQGLLRSTGTEVLPAVVRVGNTAGLNGVLAVSAGTFQAANNAGQFTSALIAGGVAGSAGDINLSGGTMIVQQQLGLGAGLGGYGSMTMSGGTLSCGSYIVVGFNNDRAVFNQSAGTTTISSNLMTIAAGGIGSIGVANISGGTFTSSFGTSSGIMVGERGVGTLNVSGAAAINVPTNNGIVIGPTASQVGWDGTLNLNGGTVTAIKVSKGLGTGVAKLNFNGGTLKGSTANTGFLTGLDNASVYANGAAFDDGGFAITVSQPLLKPTDAGVSSITLSSGGSGYINTPIVTISGGSGSNATATATVTGGGVTAVTVTCPGTGYGIADVLFATIDNGGAAVTAAVANTPTLVANVSGGLIKRGAGTLTLTGTNTYSGSNFVSAGTMLLTSAHQVTGQLVTVASNAAFGVLANAPGAAIVGNTKLGSVAADRTSLSIVLATGSNPTTPVLQTGTLTVNGTNTVRLSGVIAAGTFPLVQYTGASPTVGNAANAINPTISLPQGLAGTVSNHAAGLTLYAIVTGSPGIVWKGTNSVAALTNVWNLNAATNWLAISTPTFYMETNPPGDAVFFTDAGSGVVLLSNTASPASVTINNTAVNYAFSGTGKISGTAVVNKQGSGSATMTLTGNDYTGNTTVSGGTLTLGNGTTIPDGVGRGNVVVTNSNASLDMNGFSETINGLSGSGNIINGSATASTLTVGGGNAGGTWSGTVPTPSAGVVTLIKTGTGSLTISGTNYLGGTSQLNGGTNYLTATGRIEPIGTGEFWIQQNAGSSTLIVNGGSLSVNNWLVVGRNAATANGTMIVNSGTITKTGGGNIVVGSLNATGTLIINGGQVFNNSNLWLGENAAAIATLRLNGGLIQATQVRANNGAASSIAYFNGGVLQATAASADFIQAPTIGAISAGGLILDNNGFNLTILSSLVEDTVTPSTGGGLTKIGAGVLNLNGGNTYTGNTIVSNGTLNVNGSINGTADVKSGATLGGTGTIGGVVTVNAGGKLGAGASIGNLTLNSSPVLGGSVVAEVDRNGGTPLADLITVSGNPIAYGGTLVITNAGAPLQAGDTFTLFNAASYSGSFTLVSQTLGQIVTWNTANLAVNGTVSVAAVAQISLVPVVTGSTLNLTWPPNQLGMTLQTNSVSVASPASWFALPGSASVTNVNITIDPNQPNVFFRLIAP